MVPAAKSTELNSTYPASGKSFDELNSLGEFADTLFYMHSITDDEQFAVFLGMMYDLYGTGSHFYQDLGRLMKSNE